MVSDQKSDAEKKSNRSRSSEVKRMRGLSPPRSSSMSKSVEIYNEGVDKTQWEFSDFKDEAAGIAPTDPNKIAREQVGEPTPFLAEKKQVMAVRGEHLKEKPIYTLFFLFLELILILVALISWFCNYDANPPAPLFLCIINLILLLVATLTLLTIEFSRVNVVEEKLDGGTRFRIPYEWKYWLCWAHVLRFFLICTNITICALDNEFDGGSIIILATMPVILIVLVGHIVFALRPG